MRSGPSYTSDPKLGFEYDFTKNYKDPLHERPGIDFALGAKYEKEMKKALDRSLPCEFGSKQTPIDLSTKIPVLRGFKDKQFKFHYEPINPKAG